MTGGMSQGSSTSIERLCRLAGVSRAGYYRFWRKSAPRAHDTTMRDAIQRLALANGRHRGYRLITFPPREHARPSVRSYKLWPIGLAQHGSLTLFCALRTGPSAGARWHDGPIGTAARVHTSPYAAPRGPAVRPQLSIEW
jgi:hypothetical protein